MKNKDIFEAIDKIDDEFVNSAGKYLGGFADTDPVEVRPASKKLSTVKIIAPIAAALALVCGVTITVGMTRQSTYSPAAMGIGTTDEDDSSDIGDDEMSTPTESEDTSSDSGSVDETSTPTESETSKSDPHKWDHLYDVDEKYLPIGFDGIKLTNADGMHYLERLPEDEKEYGGFMPDFLYYADPKGANYNSIDNPEAFEWGFASDNRATFKRLAEGDKYGNLTVGEGSYITYARDAENSPNEAPIYYHGSSHLNLNGWQMIEDAYLVKMPDYPGAYYCILRNGERSLPIINATTLEDGSFGALPYKGNIGGIEYKTEIPPIVVRLHENQQKAIDEYLEEHSYAKVRVHITDIVMHHYSDLEDKIFSAGEVISIQSGDAEPKDVAEFLNEKYGDFDKLQPVPEELKVSVEELKAELMEKFGFTDVRVMRNFSNEGLEEEYTKDKLNLGNAITVYDENGLCGIYTYGDYK